MLTVFTDNILPVFFLIMLGFLLGKKIKLDPSVLTSLNFYIIIPSFMFVMLTETDLPANVALILVAATIMLVINALLGLLISKARSFDNVMSRSFASSLMFYNSGNIGIPLITWFFLIIKINRHWDRPGGSNFSFACTKYFYKYSWIYLGQSPLRITKRINYQSLQNANYLLNSLSTLLEIFFF
jgi:hypothetical protein